MRKLWCGLATVAALAGCEAEDTSSLAPAQPGDGRQILTPDSSITASTPSARVGTARNYDLAALIDLAETNNPATRAAWQTAKAAATSVGLVDAAYMPRLSAEVLAGYQASNSAALQDPLGILPAGSVNNGVGVGAAVLSAQWLLFDFGVRDAARKEAKELSLASNAAFTGVHQKLIFDVSTAYYDLWAAERRAGIQTRRAQAAQRIVDEVTARQNQQLATVTDASMAGQLVAQARFDLIRAQSEVTVARTRLASVVGLSPMQPISPAFPARLRMPPQMPAGVDAFLTDALQRRPDLQAAFARARASKIHVDAVKGEYGPKIVSSAALGARAVDASLDDSRFGSVSGGNDSTVAGVFVGVSIPLWSGGAKEQRLKGAQAASDAAQADAENLRNLAEGEIVSAYETLKSSLAANQAAKSLVASAQAGDDAAHARFAQGLATVADIAVTQRGLYDAQLSEVEAQQAALSAAATLAFASGQVWGK